MKSQIGEFVSDFVELRKEYRDWACLESQAASSASTPTAVDDSSSGESQMTMPVPHNTPVVRFAVTRPPPARKTISEKPAEGS